MSVDLTSAVSYWPLESNGNDSIGTNHLTGITDTAPTSYSAAKLGNGANFDVDVPNSMGIASNSTLQMGSGVAGTWFGWFSYTGDNASAIFAKGSGLTAATREYGAAVSGGALTFSVSNGTTVATATCPDSISINTLYFFDAWYDGSSTFGIRVNRGTAGTNTTTLIRSGTGNFWLGFRQTTQWMDGQLDSIGFFKRVLSSTELDELYNAGAGLEYPWITGNRRRLVLCSAQV